MSYYKLSKLHSSCIDISNAFAIASRVLNVGDFCPRSMAPIVGLLKSASYASCSCESPLFTLSNFIFKPILLFILSIIIY